MSGPDGEVRTRALPGVRDAGAPDLTGTRSNMWRMAEIRECSWGTLKGNPLHAWWSPAPPCPQDSKTPKRHAE